MISKSHTVKLIYLNNGQFKGIKDKLWDTLDNLRSNLIPPSSLVLCCLAKWHKLLDFAKAGLTSTKFHKYTANIELIMEPLTKFHSKHQPPWDDNFSAKTFLVNFTAKKLQNILNRQP